MNLVEFLRAIGGKVADTYAPRGRDIITPRSNAMPSVPVAGDSGGYFPSTDYEETPITENPIVTPGKRDYSKLRRTLGDAIQASFIAGSTPNIAGGGGTDILRGIAASQEWQAGQDALRRNIARQNKLDKITATRAESDLSRDRATEAYQMSRAAQLDANANIVRTPTGAVFERQPDGSLRPVYTPPTAGDNAASVNEVERRRRLNVLRQIKQQPNGEPADLIAGDPEAQVYWATGKWQKGKPPTLVQGKLVYADDGTVRNVVRNADGSLAVTEVKDPNRPEAVVGRKKSPPAPTSYDKRIAKQERLQALEAEVLQYTPNDPAAAIRNLDDPRGFFAHIRGPERQTVKDMLQKRLPQAAGGKPDLFAQAKAAAQASGGDQVTNSPSSRPVFPAEQAAQVPEGRSAMFGGKKWRKVNGQMVAVGE